MTVNKHPRLFTVCSVINRLLHGSLAYSLLNDFYTTVMAYSIAVIFLL